MHFVITFGFAIPVKSNGNIKNDESAIRNKVKIENVQHKEKEINNKIEVTQSSKNIIRIGQILAEIHVEYELLPNYNFEFDCRCWETATKIYAENDEWCLRPIPCPTKENTCWVVFSVHHLVHLSEMQIKKFINYEIIYHIFSGRQKFSERAKKDKVKGFYTVDKFIDIGQEDFLKIYPLDLYHTNSDIKPSTPPLPQPTVITHEVYGSFSIITYLDVIPDNIHEYLFRKMTRKDRFPPECLQLELFTTLIDNEGKSSLIQTKNPPLKQTKETSSKRTKKSSSKPTKQSTSVNRTKNNKNSREKQRTKPHEIHLPAESLFSDIGTITSYCKTPQLLNISDILIYTQCQDILSDKQLRMELNSISIKLEQLSNFPVDTITENGFKCLYAKIFFVNRTVVTPCYVPKTIMCFEFIKCFFCEEFQPEELINFLTTNLLTVEVIGIRIANIKKPSISTSDQLDKSVSEPVSNSSGTFTKEEVLLGVVEFDVSDLLRGFWEIKLTNSLIHPRNIMPRNINYTNDEEVKISWKNSPLTADILTSYGTSMKIKICLAYDLRMLQRKVLRRENMLNRIFFNLSNLRLAENISKDVSSHNSRLLNACQSSSKSDTLKVQGISKHVLTGFIIENCERSYIFLEGLSNGYLLKIWEKIAKLPIQHGCIYYNSNYVFLTRLYEDFIPLGGIIHIKLSQSLEVHLRNCSLYVGKTRTIIEANMIRKLGLINLTLTIKSLCQSRLFPESNDVKVFIHNIHKIRSENTVQNTKR